MSSSANRLRHGQRVRLGAGVARSQVLPGGDHEHVGVERARDALVQAMAQPQHAQRLVVLGAQVQRVAAPETLPTGNTVNLLLHSAT